MSELQDAVDHATRTLDRLMNKDLQLPSLYRNLIQTADAASVTGTRPVSGFMDYDYPPYSQNRVIPRSQFSLKHRTPIPPEISEILEQSNTQPFHMGLFPEIYRAWMTIGSDLYMWDFRDGSDLSFFDSVRDIIRVVALVPAKERVFKNAINHLLIVVTCKEISLYGILLADNGCDSNPVVEMIQQPIFTVQAEEDINFTVIHGTKSGRVFLGGNDGSIHEVNYKSEKGWITDRCWKVNLTQSYFSGLSSFFSFMSSNSKDPIVQIVSDDLRNLLFTRNRSGGLQAFDMGSDGTAFSRIGYISFEGLINDILNLSKKTLDANIIQKILTISPVTTGELHLIAVLDNGIRLYFSCFNPPTQLTQTPSYFQLVHVRMPPGFSTAMAVPKPSTSHVSLVTPNTFLLATKTPQDRDRLWLISPFMYPSNCLSEVFSVDTLPGQTMDIQSISSITDANPNPGLQNLPDVITQHLSLYTDIVILTSNGTCVYRAMKPYEILKTLMGECGGVDGLRPHYDSVPAREQPLANTVLLAIHPSTRSEPSIYDVTVNAFFTYGSTAGIDGGWGDSGVGIRSPASPNPLESTMDFNPNIVSTPQRQTQSGFHTSFASPRASGDASYISPPVAGSGVGYTRPQSPPPAIPILTSDQLVSSPRHDAIYLTVGRILFQFWNRPLVNVGVTEGANSPPIITPNVHGQEVTHAITFLQNLLLFIDSNPSLCMSRTNISASMLNLNTPEGRQLYALEVEKGSIISLRKFTILALEVLNMWKILCEHQLHIVLHGVDNQLKNSTMRDLVMSGHHTVSVIINSLISKYLGDNAAVDAISLRLRELCPTLFKSEDAIGSKVAELLARLRSCTDPAEKNSLLKESLALSEKICGHGRVNIKSLCKQYSDLGYPVGAVRLCASAARAADPGKLGLSALKSTMGAGDPEAMNVFQTLREIYGIVFDLLDNYVLVATTKQSPLARTPEDRLSCQKAQLCAEETIQAILNTEDEVFHNSLYNWLLDKKQFDRLLEIKHPYLDTFLQRAADSVISGKWQGSSFSANDTRVLDLLWRHHEMSQNHTAAAIILSKLSESTTTGLDLQQRLDYLARAIVCSKSVPRRGELEMLDDKMDIAKIQKNMLDSINARIASITTHRNLDEDRSGELKFLQDASIKLNSQLHNINDLYTQFAHPLKLHDAQLEIFYSSGVSDKGIVETIWSDIIEEELAAVGTRTMESQMEIIRCKMVTLGRKYIASPTFFPVEYLVEHLESMKPHNTENVTWVFKTMYEVGVPFPDLLAIYERLWKRLLLRTDQAGGDVEMVKVMMAMIESITAEERDTRNAFMNRLDLLERCKDLVSTMIVEFSGRFDPSTNDMSHKLNRIRDRLDVISRQLF